ncbi:MAG: SRPBCC domain-containing protein [Ginsengibacter sp.]
MTFSKLSFSLCMVLCVFSCKGQVVTNTSYVTLSGEKVLRLEVIVPIDKKKVWQYFTKDELLQKWIAPLVHIDLKTGGSIITNYNKNASLNDGSSIRLAIVNYLEEQLLTLKVKLNDNFSQKLQDEDGNLQELIQIEDTGDQKTRIISSMIGWGKGEDWDKAYDFFAKGNTWTYEELFKTIK